MSATQKPHMGELAPSMPGDITLRQKVNKGGLLVTEELDLAIQRCKVKVEKLADECRRSNRKYRDIEFDFLEDKERCLHALEPSKTKYAPVDILRVHQIFEKPEFYINGATASDIAQGAIGDCWFLSAISAVAAANLIEKICVARDEKIGIYGFIFWRDGGWCDVIIDDLLFTKIPRWEALNPKEQLLYHNDRDRYNRTARRGCKTLYFAKGLTENETWVPLLEKAYAKLHGDYASLEGGFTNEGIEDLTGAAATLIYIQDILDTDRFWDELMQANEDRLFACSISEATQPAADDEATPTYVSPTNGLMADHAYSIIKAVEFRGKRFLKIRNPWGKSEWTGRWSDGSKEWQGEWLEALIALNYGFGDDGEFIMEYSDFLATWDNVEIARLFDESWSLSQQWLSVNAGDWPKAHDFGDLSFTITVPKPTHAIIVLAQLDSRYFEELSGHYRWSLHFVLFKRGEEEEAGRSVHSALWDRSVKLETDLREGEWIVHVRLDRALKRDKGYSNNTSSWGGRKYSQKKTAYLLSTSIAANFDPTDWGTNLPLPGAVFTGGADLTDMEIAMHQEYLDQKAQAKAAFAPPEPKKLEGAPKPEGASNALPQGKKDVAPDVTVEVISEETPAGDEGGAGDEGNGDGDWVDEDDDAKDKDKEDGAEEEKPETDTVDDGTGEPPKDPGVDMSTEVAMGADAKANTIASGPPSVADEAPANPDPGFYCNGCKKPIYGVRFKCLDVACVDYDLCETCHGLGVHAPSHRMLRVPTEADGLMTREGNSDDKEGNSVVLGLRVYTHRDSPATIKGQIRHGHVIRTWLTSSKIL